MKLLLIPLLLLMLIPVTAFGEPGEKSKTPYPYVDPVVAWSDARQELARQQGPMQPVFFAGFMIEPIKKVTCDEWTPVYGIVPNDGLLTFTVVSGEYIGFHNVSHQEEYYLLNYFIVPCEESGDMGSIYITYQWNDSEDKEIYPNTKAKNLAIDRTFIQVQQIFEVVK